MEILFAHRNAFATGLNRIPYMIHKTCSKITNFFFFKFLFKVIQARSKRCEIPNHWQGAQEIYIPTVNNPSENKLSDFRSIVLLSVEGKLFFSLVSKFLETHLIHNNKFINKSIQKRCREKIPGCWEHLSMVWIALREARA